MVTVAYTLVSLRAIRLVRLSDANDSSPRMRSQPGRSVTLAKVVGICRGE